MCSVFIFCTECVQYVSLQNLTCKLFVCFSLKYYYSIQERGGRIYREMSHIFLKSFFCLFPTGILLFCLVSRLGKMVSKKGRNKSNIFSSGLSEQKHWNDFYISCVSTLSRWKGFEDRNKEYNNKCLRGNIICSINFYPMWLQHLSSFHHWI